MPLFHVGGMWYYASPAFALGCTTIVLPMFDPEVVLAAIAPPDHCRTSSPRCSAPSCHAMGRGMRREHAAARVLRGRPFPEILNALTTLTDCDFVQATARPKQPRSPSSMPPTIAAFADEAKRGRLSSCGALRDYRDPHRRAGGGDGLGDPRAFAQHHGGVLGQPGGQRTVVVDGWLHTGDVGHFDADGYLHLVDRKDDMIVTGGENVFPYEVEAARQDPDVTDAAVFGVPDPAGRTRRRRRGAADPACVRPNASCATRGERLGLQVSQGADLRRAPSPERERARCCAGSCARIPFARRDRDHPRGHTHGPRTTRTTTGGRSAPELAPTTRSSGRTWPAGSTNASRRRQGEIDRKGVFPIDLFRELGGLGYFGIMYPEEYGGARSSRRTCSSPS
jgi:hypothetical protein